MKFECRKVGEDFINSAPERFVNVVEVNASPEKIFEIFEDENQWPLWFKDIVKVTWTSPKPFGVGTTRTVKLKPLTVYENFIVWETNKRFTFYLTHTSLPLAHALIEDYVLEPIDDGKTKFTYTVVYDPKPILKLAGPLGKMAFGRMFKNAAKGLKKYID